MSVVVVMKREGKLLQVVFALSPRRGFSRLLPLCFARGEQFDMLGS